MKRSRFGGEQIIAMLKEREAGMPTAEVCRKHGVSTATLYKYKARYGGLEVSGARRLRAPEDENGKLKKLLAEAMLDHAILTDVAAEKWWRCGDFRHWSEDNGRPASAGKRWLRLVRRTG